jgi:chemotaxis protein methyltransferase CheR
METQEYEFVKREILRLIGVDLNCYKEVQMQRRLGTYLVRSGQPDWRAFFQAIKGDAGQLAKLKDHLTINVSAFVRDPEKFNYLRERLLPEMLRTRPNLRVWSAGCSRGHEPYTLAMILSRMPGPHRSHYILATDIDTGALEYARAGGPYLREDVANVPPAWLSAYFEEAKGGYRVVESLRRQITFREQNMLTGRFENGFDLIVCRNVVIYFTNEVKHELYQRLYAALRPGGILFVGGTEIVAKASEIGFETAGITFYRRRNGMEPR